MPNAHDGAGFAAAALAPMLSPGISYAPELDPRGDSGEQQKQLPLPPSLGGVPGRCCRPLHGRPDPGGVPGRCGVVEECRLWILSLSLYLLDVHGSSSVSTRWMGRVGRCDPSIYAWTWTSPGRNYPAQWAFWHGRNSQAQDMRESIVDDFY